MLYLRIDSRLLLFRTAKSPRYYSYQISLSLDGLSEWTAAITLEDTSKELNKCIKDEPDICGVGFKAGIFDLYISLQKVWDVGWQQYNRITDGYTNYFQTHAGIVFS